MFARNECPEDCSDLRDDIDTQRRKVRYVLAFYELDRRYGGPEEGGWWYDCGRLVRLFRITASEEHAYALARRANDLLHRLQRDKRDVGSVLYAGGRYACEIWENTAPAFYPERAPHYE